MEERERKHLARVIRGQRWATLATHGQGAPLASMVAYACEPDFGGFLMLLSGLSLHTRNLLTSPPASLVISEPDTGAGNPQTLARVSIQGEARPLGKDSPGYAEAKAVYEKRLSASAPLFGFEDFSLFCLVPREARFIAGFARAYTMSAEELKEAASGHDSGKGRARGSIEKKPSPIA